MEYSVRIISNNYCIAIASSQVEFPIFLKEEYTIIRLDSTKAGQESAGVPMGWAGGSNS